MSLVMSSLFRQIMLRIFSKKKRTRVSIREEFLYRHKDHYWTYYFPFIVRKWKYIILLSRYNDWRRVSVYSPRSSFNNDAHVGDSCCTPRRQFRKSDRIGIRTHTRETWRSPWREYDLMLLRNSRMNRYGDTHDRTENRRWIARMGQG